MLDSRQGFGSGTHITHRYGLDVSQMEAGSMTMVGIRDLNFSFVSFFSSLKEKRMDQNLKKTVGWLLFTTIVLFGIMMVLGYHLWFSLTISIIILCIGTGLTFRNKSRKIK